MNTGKVFLIGAGPGDPGLITVKGRENLEKADVVLYDRLVHPLLLQYVQQGAELIYCGKLPERHHLRQETIQQILVDKAAEGFTVARLKGGDPGMFGRVGEEAEALAEAGISYEMVPGITAGMAAPMYAGIPVTHRDFSGNFAAVTGHTKTEDGQPGIDWKSLAAGIDTTAFYMGMKNLGTIAGRLIENGKDPDTPAAVIEWAATSRQRVAVAPLERIQEEAKRRQMKNPAMTIVGETAALHRKLKWLEKKPLFGRFVWVVKTSAAAGSTAPALRSNGAEVLESPGWIVDTQETKQLGSLYSFDHLHIAAEESVDVLFDEMKQNRMDLRALPGRISTASRRTLEKLESYGLFAGFTKENPGPHSLWIGPEHACREAEAFSQKWVSHRLTPAKGVQASTAALLQNDWINTVVVPSSQAVHVLWKELDRNGLSPVEWLINRTVTAHGPEIEKSLRNRGVKPTVTLPSPDTETLINALSNNSVPE
ncbi:uroporphyrinogen-III C-methyltransferase [Salibacterium halotolerans]|uniref:Uroporphyrinogen-III C-methyltransferase n=1 Tax=Salibacterium halotolerans TaxID=1884432 RepID=A0A1I5RIR4_9BACI|nr:uroporphyrinogen-III C-methyltransferase [Salibacterium halotolerans]SFP58197.1 uroporphyrinogen III methyltransferase / synthase [Salibacterium halotolerans]